MKTREQIYGKEATDILRNITTYHYIRHDQLLRFYPGKVLILQPSAPKTDVLIRSNPFMTCSAIHSTIPSSIPKTSASFQTDCYN